MFVNDESPDENRRGLKANILPENVAASSSPSSVPMHPPDTDVTGSPQN